MKRNELIEKAKMTKEAWKEWALSEVIDDD